MSWNSLSKPVFKTVSSLLKSLNSYVCKMFYMYRHSKNKGISRSLFVKSVTQFYVSLTD